MFIKNKQTGYQNIYNESEKFIELVNKCLSSKKTSLMYLIRESGFIKYGANNKTTSIPMISNSDFISFYSKLTSFFENELTCAVETNGFRIFISDNVVVNINSDNEDDIKWIYNDITNEKEIPFKK